MPVYDPQIVQRIRSNPEILEEVRGALLPAVLSFEAEIAGVARKVAEVTGLDFPTAQTLVASLSVDAARGIQTLAAAEARASGVPLLPLATAMGYRSATPLQRDGQRIKDVQMAQEHANSTGAAQEVTLEDGWTWVLPPRV